MCQPKKGKYSGTSWGSAQPQARRAALPVETLDVVHNLAESIDYCEAIHTLVVRRLRADVDPGIDSIDYNAPLTAQGVDSICAAVIAADLERMTGVRFGPELVYQYPTINRLAEYLVGTCGPACQQSVQAEGVEQPALPRNGVGDTEPSPSLLTYGCRLNHWSVEELFRRYEAGGFLDESKKARLAPFWELIKDNWLRGLASSEGLLYFMSHDPDSDAWAAVASWRTTSRGWVRQHLVSTNPSSARQVLLASLGRDIHLSGHEASQIWFQSSKRMPREVLATIPTRAQRDQAAAVLAYTYLALPLSQPLTVDRSIKVYRHPPRSSPEFIELIRSARGQVYLSAEELDGDDLNLEGIDNLYRQVGLRRYRRVYAAEIPGRPGLAGALIVYRGPLGLNFSFLENRTEVITAQHLSADEAASVTLALVAPGRPVYADFEPEYVPLVAADREASAMIAAGATTIRKYSQAISLRAGYLGIYDHVRHSYDERVRQGVES
jgi:acyl carrier protein